MSEFAQVSRHAAGHDETVVANRAWWDAESGCYQEEHGAFLGDTDLVWGPEGWTEEDLGLLGPLAADGLVLEIGGGAGQGARWVAGTTPRVVSSDLSRGMLGSARRLNRAHPERCVPLLQCDAARLPFGPSTFDVVFTAYGAVPFVADSERVMTEACRVLRPGGRFVFSTTHPFRWALPDVPGEAGLTVHQSYFDRRPYVEVDSDGETMYVEHHRTLGDRVREITAAGLHLVDVVEPEWPERTTQTWGGWSPLRGRLVPGTAIYVARKPA